MPERETTGQRVLVLAPTGRDAALISAMLQNSGLNCLVCADVEQFAFQIRAGAGIGLMAEEALVGNSLQPLLTVLAEQPAWSDFPLLFLTTTGMRASETSTRLLQVLGPEANVTILERPVRLATLLSGVRFALRARRRQFQVREYLEQRKRHQEELLQIQKLESLGVLAGGVAHDFNNLLTGILANASLALDSLPPGWDKMKSALEDVIGASERAANLTRQLLAYAGKGRFVIEPLDLSSMVKAVTHLIESAVSKNATLHLDLRDNTPAIEGDAVQLQQIIMNLVINAAEAIPPEREGHVFVSVGAQHMEQEHLKSNLPSDDLAAGQYVKLEVRDNGTGMNQSTLACIFDPFYTTKFTGRGLGLAAVQGIVRTHQGSLKVDSVEGEGTTFQICFPASCLPVLEPAAPIPPAWDLPEAAATILVIDDEITIRKTASTVLKRRGWETQLAGNGAEGIAILAQNPEAISLVLLDLTMPGMGGEEVFIHLRQIRPDLKVILSSGFNETEVVQQFAGKGLAGFIQKPYTASALAAIVRKVLAQEAG